MTGEKIDEGDTEGNGDCSVEIKETKGTVETEGARDIKERGEDAYGEEASIGGWRNRWWWLALHQT